MMLKRDAGFFGMWNGIAPESALDFSLMHTRDHVPEHLGYLGAEGMTWARRYTDGVGDMPPFFTLYAMHSLDRITDPSVKDAKAWQTDWFKSMRPHYRDRLPLNCRVLGSGGAGIGSAVATQLLDLAPVAPTQAGIDRFIGDLLRLAPVTAAHLGIVEWQIPIHVGGVPESGPAASAVLLVESFNRFELVAALAAIEALVLGHGIAKRVRNSAHYGLAYGLTYEEIDHLRNFRRDDALASARHHPTGAAPQPGR